ELRVMLRVMLRVVFRVRGGVTIRTCVAAGQVVRTWLPCRGAGFPCEFAVECTSSALPLVLRPL
ncbi:MAG: hypothetical protein ACKPJJ_18790, partial [Planctomycetaceae bacterium]